MDIPVPRSRAEEETQLLQAIAASLGEEIDAEELRLSSSSPHRQSYGQPTRALTPPTSPNRLSSSKNPRGLIRPRGEFC